MGDESSEERGGLIILYGSQTGNAEDLARRMGYMAKARGMTNVTIQRMDDYKFKNLIRDKFIIFVCSTTGHGQEPENMRLFLNFLRRRELPKNCLVSLRCAVFGIGDSSYAKFNWVAKILYKRLIQCGAVPVQELTLGDEQHPFGCDENIYPRLLELWPKLETILPPDPRAKVNYHESMEVFLPTSSYTIHVTSKDSLNSQTVCPFSPRMVSQYNIQTGLCIGNERLTAEDHFQDTRLVKISSQGLKYEPGDVCSIFPANLEENVQEFIKLLNLDPDSRVKLAKKDPNFMQNYLFDFVGDNIRIYDLVKYYLDIQSVPKRTFFQFLWHFSQNDLERQKLKELSTTQGQEELYEYCTQPKRTILEVLGDFPNTVPYIKFDYLFDIIPPIKPRSFSIASSLRCHPDQIHLIVGVVNYRTRLRKRRLGLCSNYLARLKHDNSEHIFFYVKKTNFKILDAEKPVIMIGPGTGIAPFRAFLQDRSQLAHSSEYVLYFGCRYRDKDYYFCDELKGYQQSGFLSLSVAFSREKPKSYVQDLIMEQSEEFLNLLLRKGASIFVAGNSKLPEDLRRTLTKMLFGQSQLGNFEEFIVSLELNRRIQYDCW